TAGTSSISVDLFFRFPQKSSAFRIQPTQKFSLQSLR
ncbi:MAG: hypothetical protein ACI8UZ_000939, partial [Akkermansiaceae bacterium]